MKLNRMRLYQPKNGTEEHLRKRSVRYFQIPGAPISLEELPAPLAIEKISPDQLIEDILISTLKRVQNDASPEVAAAAARYISLLAEKAL